MWQMLPPGTSPETAVRAGMAILMLEPKHDESRAGGWGVDTDIGEANVEGDERPPFIFRTTAIQGSDAPGVEAKPVQGVSTIRPTAAPSRRSLSTVWASDSGRGRIGIGETAPHSTNAMSCRISSRLPT